jgi:hypothetical protein
VAAQAGYRRPGKEYGAPSTFGPARVVDELKAHAPGGVHALTAGGACAVAIDAYPAPVAGYECPVRAARRPLGRIGRHVTGQDAARRPGGSAVPIPGTESRFIQPADGPNQ